MPRGDRTGPAGLGPMTGRAAGFCAGYPAPGYANAGWGRGGGGRGWGRGWGRGGGGGGGGAGWQHRHRYWATGVPGWQNAWMAGPGYAPPFPLDETSREQQLELLKNQAKHFEQTLHELRERIGELEASSEGSKT